MLYNLHTHSASNIPEVFEVVNRYPYEVIDVSYFSTGIHPWHIDTDKVDEHLAIIEQRLQLPNCLALGECGLDKRIEIPLNIQVEVFEKQLVLAKKYQKPVILHLVAAFQELKAIKNRLQPGVPMIVHGFSKNAQVAKQLLDNGFYLSFGKYLLRTPELSAVFAGVPEDRFLLETDTIEEGIADVYAKAALARNMDIDVLKSIVENNFKNIFKDGGMDRAGRAFV
ncbi:TatD family deoxyribonuclease [Flavobacterium zepuense]|uniref:TatD family deoxyribonuclease n=1 Tax=Flavobacterium zepuense TaxID=2593302 RepID=A0A552VAC3_9FLAO|nr:TatD family hydrolase [Flavobacterium zepuense]TRW27422.1 TatD family deoxyribonuclease [Flavobacterium zepuense]